ncbi:MAG: Ubiquitin-protein ligase, partial [Paramarteilia canceri]
MSKFEKKLSRKIDLSKNDQHNRINDNDLDIIKLQKLFFSEEKNDKTCTQINKYALLPGNSLKALSEKNENALIQTCLSISQNILISPNDDEIEFFPAKKIFSLLRSHILSFENVELVNAIINMFNSYIDKGGDSEQLQALCSDLINKIKHEKINYVAENVIKFFYLGSYCFIDKLTNKYFINNLINMLFYQDDYIQQQTLNLLTLIIEHEPGNKIEYLDHSSSLIGYLINANISETCKASVIRILKFLFKFFSSLDLHYREITLLSDIADTLFEFISIDSDINDEIFNCIVVLLASISNKNDAIKTITDLKSFSDLLVYLLKQNMNEEYGENLILLVKILISSLEISRKNQNLANISLTKSLNFKNKEVKIKQIDAKKWNKLKSDDSLIINMGVYLGFEAIKATLSEIDFEKIDLNQKVAYRRDDKKIYDIKFYSKISPINKISSESLVVCKDVYKLLCELIIKVLPSINNFDVLEEFISYIVFFMVSIDRKYENKSINICLEHLLKNKYIEFNMMAVKLILAIYNSNEELAISLLKSPSIGSLFNDILKKKSEKSVTKPMKKILLFFENFFMPIKVNLTFESDELFKIVSKMVEKGKNIDKKLLLEFCNFLSRAELNYHEIIRRNLVKNLETVCHNMHESGRFSELFDLLNSEVTGTDFKPLHRFIEIIMHSINVSSTLMLDQSNETIKLSSSLKLFNLLQAINKVPVTIAISMPKGVSTHKNSLLVNQFIFKCKLSMTVKKLASEFVEKINKENGQKPNLTLGRNFRIHRNLILLIKNIRLPEDMPIFQVLLISNFINSDKNSPFPLDTNEKLFKTIKKLACKPLILAALPRTKQYIELYKNVSPFVPGILMEKKYLAKEEKKVSLISNDTLSKLELLKMFLDYNESAILDLNVDLKSIELTNIIISMLSNSFFQISGTMPLDIHSTILKFKHNLSLQMRKSLFSQTALISLRTYLLDISEIFFSTSGVRLFNFPNEESKIYRQFLLQFAMEHFAKHRNKIYSHFEFNFDEEVGFGLGPTLEFYSGVCKNICSYKNAWFVCDSGFLHPKPNYDKNPVLNEISSMFTFIGQLIAKSLIDSKLITIPLSIPFLKALLGQRCSFSDLEFINKEVYNSLLIASKMDNIEDIGLYFIDPFNESLLKSAHSGKIITNSNFQHYIDTVVDRYFNTGIRYALDCFIAGFSQYCSINLLKFFTAKEISEILNGVNISDQLTEKLLTANIAASNGYSLKSMPIKYFIDFVASSSSDIQRKLIKFITGSPRLPVGGLKDLNPPLTVAKRDSDHPDQDFPT